MHTMAMVARRPTQGGTRWRMRWSTAVFLTLALALPWGAVGPHVAAVGAEPLPRGVYLALGDSLAIGYGATDPARLGYVPRFFEYVHGKAHGGVGALENVGVGGATSTSLLTGGQLASALTVINDPDTDVRVVTLDIGGNDLLALIQQSPPGTPAPVCLTDPGGVACQTAIATTLAAFAANYAAILTQLTTALAADPGDETIYVLAYYNHLSGTGHAYESLFEAALLGLDATVSCDAAPRSWGMNDIIACVGAQMGAHVADAYPGFAGKGAALTHVNEGGDFHPTNAGYAIIANAFMRAAR